MFHCFVKILPRTVEPELVSVLSSCNLQCRATVSSVPWGLVLLFSKFGSLSNILFFVLSMFWNTPEISFHVKFFESVTFSETPLSFSSQPSSWMSIRWPSLRSCGYQSRVKWWPQQHSHGQLFLQQLYVHLIQISIPSSLIFMSSLTTSFRLLIW